MKTGAFLLVLVIVCTTTRAQTPYSGATHPGGVKGAVRWYSADAPASAAAGLYSQLPNDTSKLTYDRATMSTLNFHPALVLDGRHGLPIQLGKGDWRSASFFTVYQSTDTANENTIWHTTINNTTNLVLTTDRLADLPVYKYMNFRDVIRQQPKVNVYVQQKEKDSNAIGDQVFTIGQPPVTPRVPVTHFKGLLPELIIYDRVLNSTERLQVASWLSLKYGITLTEPGATYLNSHGEPIWKGYDYPQWHNNIAGIGRDDAAGFNQAVASSSNVPALLTIATTDTLNDQSFLLWGDNNLSLTPAIKTPGQPIPLQRTWLVKPSGNYTPYATTVQIDTRMIDAPLPVQPVFWLAIDRTGKGQFNSFETEYYQANTVDKQGIATFNNLQWDTDASGKDVFGMIAGPALLVQTLITPPACSSPGTGKLAIRATGGKAPYQLVLKGENGFTQSEILHPTSEIGLLAAGKYVLTITDANHHRYIDSFYINHTDVPLPALQTTSYTLPATGTLAINAGSNLPSDLSWEWSGPNNFQLFSSQAQLTTPGVYTVRCGKNGCFNEQAVTVKAIPANILTDITVYPNPSTGKYAARVTLDEPAAVTMSVYGPDGRLITTQQGAHRSNYLFTGELKVNGVYELVFTSGLSKTTKRLVITK